MRIALALVVVLAGAGIGATDSRYCPISFPNLRAPTNYWRYFLRHGGVVKRAALSCLIVGAGLLAAALPAAAHHGTLVSYDRDKQWTREVVVTRFNYANPHPQIFFDVTDDKGVVVHWAGELLPNPAGLLRVGWTKSRSLQALAPGTKINITIAPARAGGVVGLVMRMRNLDGADIVSDSVPYPEAAVTPAQP